MNKVRLMVSLKKPKVLAICETWIQEDPLNPWFYPSECLLLKGYNLYRYDNPNCIRGGIIIYVSSKYDGGKCKKMNNACKEFKESA